MKTKVLQIVACVLIAVVLAGAGVVGLSIGLRSYRAAVRLDDITLDIGTVIYLASVYRMSYEGENFEADFKTYLSDLVADAYLYALHHGYTFSDRSFVNNTAKRVLAESADGSVTEFNDVAKEHGYGFTYTDFRNAIALKYKAAEGRSLMPEVLGEEGYAEAKAQALSRIVFTDRYTSLDFATIPNGHEYYFE